MKCAQFEQRNTIQQLRAQIWNSYQEHLADWAEEHRVQLPTVPANVEQAYHMYYMLLPSLEVRTRIINHLKARGIQSVFHYLPLHLSDMGKEFGGRAGDCPVTESISDRLLRLPFYNTLSSGEIQQVVEALYSFTDWY